MNIGILCSNIGTIGSHFNIATLTELENTALLKIFNEFKDIFDKVEIAIIFGSIVRTPKTANDMDILLVFQHCNLKAIKKYLDEKNNIMIKPVHAILQTPQDFEKNLQKNDPVILNALSKGYVIYGQEKLIEAIKHVTGFKES